METKTKVIIGILVVGLGVGAFLYIRKKKKEKEGEVKADSEPPVEPPVNPKVDPIVDPTPITKTVTVATSPPPVVNISYKGKTFKSRGENKFPTYSYKDVARDVKNADNTVSRKTTKELVKNETSSIDWSKGYASFKDNQTIGKVTGITGSGFWMSLGNGNYVWANAKQLIS